jgi:hypothetical protein
MKQSTLKGLFHAGLVVAALVEMRTATTNMRRLLLGACCGWHCSAAYDHFVREPRTMPIIEKVIRAQHKERYGNLDAEYDEEG